MNAPLPADEVLAASTPLRLIGDVARDAGLLPSEIEPWGHGVAKVDAAAAIARLRARPQGRLVLVTAMTPTKAGEGKTVTTIGLAQALHRIGQRTIACLRQPSLGPIFGIKGCASGTGRSQLLPREAINLRLTGDFDAIAAAHNLLAAVADASLHHGNPEGIAQLAWRRTLDVCDRALREVTVALGGAANGTPHQSGFDITAASEIMAAMALAEDLADLRARLARIVVGWTGDGMPVRAESLRCVGSMMALLRDALRPNLVQTIEGAPALVHTGPFANIAHGCSSVVATRLALHAADWVVTEAGFGADLGAEKFLHLKCRGAGLAPSAAVLVASVRALRLHGGSPQGHSGPDPEAVARGIANLRTHAENLASFGIPVVIAANRFPDDSAEELALVLGFAEGAGLRFAISEAVVRGAEGGEALARAVMEAAAPGPVALQFAYPADAPLPDKVDAIARRIYRADGVDWSPAAEVAAARLERAGFGGLPVCMAKTQSSISDDPKRPGAPRGWRLTVRDLRVSAGAGFVVALTGKMQLMPGLPRDGRYLDIDLAPDGRVTGLR
jgi:formate--tetrahydrofolate ligase